jgi:hypothetical protein
MDVRTAGVASLIDAINGIASETSTTFGQLTPEQLNWKPSAERWSVAQCFDHLLTSNRGYLPIVDRVLAGEKPTLWQKMPLLPGLMGKLLIKSLDPASTRKLKAPKSFQPAASDIRDSVINDFIDQQARIAEKMKASEHLDLAHIVITSPAAAVVTYSLLDGYRIIVVHERRHLLQAKRVTEEAAFPA